MRHVLARGSGQAISGLSARLSWVNRVDGLASTMNGAAQAGPGVVAASPERSLTSESKKGKRRRRSPGGSKRRLRVLRIEQTLAISAFQPSPRRIRFGATRVACAVCEGARYAEIPWSNLQANQNRTST